METRAMAGPPKERNVGKSGFRDFKAERESMLSARRLCQPLPSRRSSVRRPGGECAGLFYPDRARNVVQGRHLDYHWNGTRVDFVRDAGTRQVYAIAPAAA